MAELKSDPCSELIFDVPLGQWLVLFSAFVNWETAKERWNESEIISHLSEAE